MRKTKFAALLMVFSMLSPAFLTVSLPAFAQEATQTETVSEDGGVVQNTEATQDPVVEAPTQSEWSAFLEGLGGVKGASTLAIVALVVQGLMLALKSGLGSIAGKYQLALVYGLTLVGGVLALKMQGMDWGTILIHSSTMSAVQVFLHQVYKQFVEKTA